MFGSLIVDPPLEAEFDEQWPPEESYEQWPPSSPSSPSSPAERLPSGWLGLELDSTTSTTSAVDVMDDADLVDAIVAFDRMSSWALARQARLLAEFSRRRPRDAREAANCDIASAASPYAPDEIGMALRLSRGTAMARLGQSVRLVHRLPDTLALWEQGRIDVLKVRAICDVVHYLDPEVATAVERRVLPQAPEQTLAQLRAALAKAVIAADPDGAAQRHRAARKERRVSVGEENDGMASLLPAPDALSAFEWLSRLARSLGSEDPRGMDARRADLLAALLTGRLTFEQDLDAPGEPDDGSGGKVQATEAAPTADDMADGEDITSSGAEGSAPVSTAIPASSSDPAAGIDAVDDPANAAEPADGPDARRERIPRRPAAPGKPLMHVVVPYSTLIGADDQPCELAGYGPIPAELAREIAADAVWKRLVVDPLSGSLLDHGRKTYRPPEALADFVRARDVLCRSPICRRRALDCELDHALAWKDGGHTVDTNLWAGCPHDHHLKHDAGWTVIQHADGRITWTTPTGHSYTGEPHDYRPESEPASRRPVPAAPPANAVAVEDDDDPPPF